MKQSVSRMPVRHVVESEDEVKRLLARHLEKQGFQVKVCYGRAQGPDLVAWQESERLVVEVKGPGKYPQMRVNFFLAVLGEILRRMSDPNARYAIAFPDHPQYWRLWNSLSAWAKQCLRLTAFFVGEDVKEVN